MEICNIFFMVLPHVVDNGFKYIKVLSFDLVAFLLVNPLGSEIGVAFTQDYFILSYFCIIFNAFGGELSDVPLSSVPASAVHGP